MEIVCIVNGKEIQRDPYGLDYLEFDIVKDLIRPIEHLETNPSARIEVDLTYPEKPEYNLINCTDEFRNRFYRIFSGKQAV